MPESHSHTQERPAGGAHEAAPGLLHPLDEFYARAGRRLPAAQCLEGDQVPEPYRRLLVHNCDMTPTLEAFFGDRIHLRVMDCHADERVLARQVALLLRESDRPVEFGAIIIHCWRFPAAAQEVVRACRVPLGTILADHGIRHTSRPQAFFRLQADRSIGEALRTEKGSTLYGRRNALLAPEGWPLAEVLEVLPPLEQ